MVRGGAVSEETVLRSSRWKAHVLRAALKEQSGNGRCELEEMRSRRMREVAPLRQRGEGANTCRVTAGRKGAICGMGAGPPLFFVYLWLSKLRSHDWHHFTGCVCSLAVCAGKD